MIQWKYVVCCRPCTTTTGIDCRASGVAYSGVVRESAVAASAEAFAECKRASRGCLFRTSVALASRCGLLRNVRESLRDFTANVCSQCDLFCSQLCQTRLRLVGHPFDTSAVKRLTSMSCSLAIAGYEAQECELLTRS